MPRLSFGRRQALRALAAIPATAAFARDLAAAPAPPAPRLVIVMQNNGTQQANFWPNANLSSPILDSLFTDPKTGADNGLRTKTNIIKGVTIPYDANGTAANQHDMGFARMFTGAQLMSQGGQPWGGAISVDQILAGAWHVDSLTLAVLASETEPNPKPGFDHRQSFCYLGPEHSSTPAPIRCPSTTTSFRLPPAPMQHRASGFVRASWTRSPETWRRCRPGLAPPRRRSSTIT